MVAGPASPGMETDQVAKPAHLNENLLNRSIAGNFSAEKQAVASVQASREVSPAMRNQASVQSSAADPAVK